MKKFFSATYPTDTYIPPKTMKTTTMNEVEKNTYAVLLTLADQVLKEDGFVALGGLLSSILGEEDGAYDGVSTECIRALAELTDIHVQAIYEMVLFQLESELGPLNCRDVTDGVTSDEVWSYAGPQGFAISPTIDDFYTHRSKAFHEGHPDQYRDFDRRTLPRTIWYVAESTDCLAA